MPLTKEEEAALAELEAEVAAEAPELPKNVRPERFSSFPVGMADDGTLFPLTPGEDEDEDEAPGSPVVKER